MEGCPLAPGLPVVQGDILLQLLLQFSQMVPLQEAVRTDPDQHQQAYQQVPQTHMNQPEAGHFQQRPESVVQQKNAGENGDGGIAPACLDGGGLDFQIRVHLPEIGSGGAVDEEIAVAVHIFPTVFFAKLPEVLVRYVAEALARLLGLQPVFQGPGHFFDEGQPAEDLAVLFQDPAFFRHVAEPALDFLHIVDGAGDEPSDSLLIHISSLLPRPERIASAASAPPGRLQSPFR